MRSFNKYAQDGVNVAEGDDFSAFSARVCQSTYGNSPFVEVVDTSHGHFRGPRGYRLKGLPEGYCETIAPDGIGTKVIIIDSACTHRDAPRDVVAMTCGDISRWGGIPLIFSNVLDVSTLGEKGDSTNHAFREMMTGLGQVAHEQGFVVLNGETAELGPCVGSENAGAFTKFNWAGFCLGVYHPQMMITGERLAPGQKIVALREPGFRCNGISSVRAALRLQFGEDWWNNSNAHEAIQAAATPALLHDRLLTAANGWYAHESKSRIPMHLIVHVTGGAIQSKLAEDILFPKNLSANMNELWEPPEIMRQCAEWRGMSDEELYNTWNGGQGALVVLSDEDVQNFIALAEVHRIQAKVCGEITRESTSQVRIISKFSGKEIVYSSKC